MWAELLKQFDVGQQFVLHIMVQLAVLANEIVTQVNFPLHYSSMHHNNYAVQCIYLNRPAAQSTSTVDFSNPPNIVISDGSFTETFANGTLLGTSSGSGTANGKGTASVTLDFVIPGGTGYFAGATGDVSVSGTITSTSATTESFSGSYTGSLANVPEPSSLVLLIPMA